VVGGVAGKFPLLLSSPIVAMREEDLFFTKICSPSLDAAVGEGGGGNVARSLSGSG